MARPRLADLVASLRAPLLRARAEAGMPAAELGTLLRQACDRLCAVPGALPPERVGPIRAWRARLERFERLTRDEQEVEVARGLRLCAVLGGGVGGTPIVEPPSRDSAGRAWAGARGEPPAGPAPRRSWQERRDAARARRAGADDDGAGVDGAGIDGAGDAGAGVARRAGVAGAGVARRAGVDGAGVARRAGVTGPVPLDAPVTALGGVGPVWAARLADKGVRTVEDLAWLVPRRYDDLRHVVPLGAALAGPVGERVTFVAAVARVRFSRFRRRFLEVRLVEPPGDGAAAPGSGAVTARWFHAHPGLAARFVVGQPVVLSGVLRAREGAFELANPDILGAPDGEGAGARATLRPRYAEVEGVPGAVIRRVCHAAAERVAPQIVGGVPDGVAARLGLPPLGEALCRLHAPPQDLSVDEVAALDRGDSPWHRRLAFDELFVLALAVAQRRVERRAHEAPASVPPPGALEGALGAFPFALTSAQRRAVDEIAADLAETRPMNRLLQGDVGSGKTAVAFAAAHLAIAAGRQVAIMAPTELLAEQHLASIGPWARALGHRVALLTASTPRGVRESTLGLLAAGQIQLLVGTHALLAERVAFADLGLVVIDEQHRFGVQQRIRLRAKGDADVGGIPHLLVMTATPIPRTLALTVYGDLDVTTLDELPPGRQPTATKVLAGARAGREALALLRRELDAGGRAFVVCPLVEPSEEAPEWADATTTAERLTETLAPWRVGLVHGRMPAAERDAQMAALRAGELDVLVATTVIEVGVDVPEARAMVVLDADRFGLAQLHQLRGRVGRGGDAAVCLLVTRGARTSEASRRLAVMEATCDGFQIAEEDLAIRGPGELLGVRQAGLPALRFGDLVKHAGLAALARREAEALLDDDPALARPEHAGAARVLAARLAAAAAVGAEGG